MKSFWIMPLLFFVSIFISAEEANCEIPCRKDRSVFDDEKSSKLKMEVAKAFELLLMKSLDKEKLTLEQDLWLEKSIEQCKNEECLVDVYRERLQYLRKAFQKPDFLNIRYDIVKGQQYSVCQAMNSYFNSSYYHEDDCFIRPSLEDSRISSPRFHQVDFKKYIEQYVQYLVSSSSLSDEKEAAELYRKNVESGRVLFWELSIDVDNDGDDDRLLMVKSGNTDATGKRLCNSLTGSTLFPLEGEEFSANWRGVIPVMTPFLFEGRTFVILGAVGPPQVIQEPFAKPNSLDPTRAFTATTVCEFNHHPM